MKLIVVNGDHLELISLFDGNGFDALRHFRDDLPRFAVGCEAGCCLGVEAILGLGIAHCLAIESEDHFIASVMEMAFGVDDRTVHWNGNNGAGEVVLRLVSRNVVIWECAAGYTEQADGGVHCFRFDTFEVFILGGDVDLLFNILIVHKACMAT